MNHTLHAQSLYPDFQKPHTCVCPLRGMQSDLMKTIMPDFEQSDTIKRFSNLISVWHTYVAAMSSADQSLDGFFLLCTNDGYVIDIDDPKCQSRLIHNHEISSGIHFFRIISQWEKSDWLGQADACMSDVCAHPIMPEFCPTMPLYAILSPLQTTHNPEYGATLVFVTPYITALTIPLIRSIAMGIVYSFSYEMNRRENEFVRDALLGNLDCHMIFLDTNHEVTEEIHPIKLDIADLNQMHKITSQESCILKKQTIGNRVYQVNIFRLNQDDPQSHMILGLFRDMTRVELYADRLRDLEKFSSLVTLSAGIAHEIRNPLTTARGFLQLFLKKSDSPSDKQFLALTITELDRIQTLLRDFMNIAKPDIKNRQSVDLVSLVREVIHFMRPEASLQNVELICNICSDCVTIEADAGQMKQVFINILQNAVQACENRGHVTISANVEENHVNIQFSDTGCGIADVSQLFHPFYTTKESGTGLGLVVSKHIIEEHRGKIEIESKEGQGTSVRVMFPLSKTNRN